MKRSRALGSPFPTTAAIILAESDDSAMNHRHAGSDPLPVGLDALQVKLDEVVAIAVVLEEIMLSDVGLAGLQGRSDAIFHHEVEKAVVVVVAPGRELVCGSDLPILERNAFLGGHVRECSVAIVMIKNVGVTRAKDISHGQRYK